MAGRESRFLAWLPEEGTCQVDAGDRTLASEQFVWGKRQRLEPRSCRTFERQLLCFAERLPSATLVSSSPSVFVLPSVLFPLKCLKAEGFCPWKAEGV